MLCCVEDVLFCAVTAAMYLLHCIVLCLRCVVRVRDFDEIYLKGSVQRNLTGSEGVDYEDLNTLSIIDSLDD